MNDSLPYIEAVHEDYEEYALALIEEEMKQLQPRPMNRLKDIQFRTEMMKTEYQARVVNGQFQPREEISYHPPKIARPNNLEEWRTIAIPQAKSRFESERIRGLVLESEKEEAVANWQAYNSQILEPLLAQLNTSLTKQREEVEEINYQRQNFQQQLIAPQLDQLTTDYEQILYRRNQLEHAMEGLRRGAALTGNHVAETA